ncbi:unnamed protein product [Cercospora beticola]|nr:unnamed protein product [Cercospora beticola]
MAPLTRFRAEDDHVHSAMAKEYYEQRGSVAGSLIITEATFISKKASGYPNVPGIWSKEQVESWKRITESVSERGSHMYLQLWALGRVGNPKVKEAEGTGDVVSASPVPEKEGAPIPRELSDEEIREYIQDYATAAKNAIEAGFAGVELHGANGYLIDQFLQETSNKRTDKWGSSIENRARFAIEVTKAVVDAIGSKKVGIRLSPFSTFQGMGMSDPIPQFTYLVSQLKKLQLSYVHFVDPRIDVRKEYEATASLEPLVKAWENTSPVFIAGGFTPEIAKKTVDEEYKDYDVVVVFGKYYISNPDLVFRLQKGLPLTDYDRSTFYVAKKREGYVDYPFSQEFAREKKL